MDGPDESSSAASLIDETPEARIVGLLAFHRRRKQDSRDRLLAAAMKKFCERGYFSVSVEEIASAAGVSRMTFYRHFNDKAALTADLFRHAAGSSIPLFMSIGDRCFKDHAVVRDWIAAVFAADRANRRLLRVFTQATADEGDFTEQAQTLISDLIVGLGRSIPAFDADPDKPDERRQWHEAWLLLYELLDQSNHAALGSGVANDPVLVDILTDRFVRFVQGVPEMTAIPSSG